MIEDFGDCDSEGCVNPATGPDGWCDSCRVGNVPEAVAGGECTRCALSLVDGFCPNDRCPFHDTFQDELVEDWSYPGDEERSYIAALKN